MYLLFKCIAGALIMLAIHFLTKSTNYFLTGLIVLFPVFSVPAYYFLYYDKGVQEVQKTNMFAISSIIAYVGFVLTVYFVVPRCGILTTLSISVAVWLILALMILLAWKQLGYA